MVTGATQVSIRPARTGDEPVITRLIRQLAASLGEASSLGDSYALRYMETPGAGALVAVLGGRIVGLVSYTLRPNLYHAAPCLMIEELVVDEPFRGRGLGGSLLDAVVAFGAEKGCAEVSVSTMTTNTAALDLYRKHGFGDEAVLLERHL